MWNKKAKKVKLAAIPADKHESLVSGAQFVFGSNLNDIAQPKKVLGERPRGRKLSLDEITT